MIAAGTHDLDALIDVVVEITTPPPTVDMNRLRSQIDVWLNRYLLIGVGTSRHGCDHRHGHGAAARQRPRVAGRLVNAVPGHAAAPGTRSRSQHRSPSHGVARAVHEEVAGRAVRPAACSPDTRAERFEAGTVWLHPCPATSRRSSSRSAPVDSQSSSASTMPMARSIISSTASSRPRRWSRPAQLLSRRTGPTVGPISVPGLVAAGVGVLTWQRLVRRRREHKTWVSLARELGESRRRARDAS